MKCTNCGHRMLLWSERIRSIRRSKGLCAQCGKPSVKYYRCVGCRYEVKLRWARR
jgi:primosomal protein N'